MNEQKILLIDADREFLAAVAGRLVAEGYQVCTATDAVQGWQGFRTHCPDLVLLSLDLPGGGGLRVHEHIRRVDDTNVPVVYITPPGANPLREEAMALGAAALLEQPVAIDEVVTTVRELLTDRGVGRGAGRSKSLRFLVVESDEARCAAIRRGLASPGRENVETTFARTAKEACWFLQRFRYGCVLLSDRLPDGDGLDILDDVDESILTTPVIAVAGDDLERCVEFFRAGCIDVLSSEQVLASENLRRDVARALARFQRRAMATVIDRRQLGDAIVRSQEGLISLARTDALMGICNRAVFEDYHGGYHDQITRRKGSYALCMIDVDNFKSYNDLYGHSAGDQILRQVADSLSSMLRGPDFIARYGGEEIVVMLEGVTTENLIECVDRLRRGVSDRAIEHRANVPHGVVTVSIGAACFTTETVATATDVLESADQALYRAKRLGRNRAETVMARRVEARATA